MLKKSVCAIAIVMATALCLTSAFGQQEPKPKQPASQTAAKTIPPDVKPLTKELSEKLVQYANLRAKKQKELAESEPARELALINDAIEVLVANTFREMGLDSKKWTLRINDKTGLLEAVPLAVPEPQK